MDYITMNVSINAVTNSAKLREVERERKKNLMRTFFKKKGLRATRMRFLL